MSSPATTEGRHWRAAIVITVVAALVRLVFAAMLPLFPDETYYWDWSRHLASGYFDHPPAIAVLIWLGTTVGGSATPFTIRLFPVIAGAVACLFATMIARRIAGGFAARSAAWMFALMPLAATGLVLATPDAPLLATTSVALYAIVRALESKQPLAWWIAAGAALGLAFSSKYTSILLPMTIAVALVVRPSLRAQLKTPGPYVACVVATIAFLPVLLWNSNHDWISFRFQLQHGLGAPPKGSPLKRELDLVGGQLGVVSPILFALATAAVWRTLRERTNEVQVALAIVAAGSWVFFVYSAIRKSVEANWPAPAYMAALPLLAVLIADERWRTWIVRGTALAGVMVAVIYAHTLHPFLPLPARRDPIARNAGWREFAESVDRTRSVIGGTTHVGADRYQDVSELAFHLPDRPITFCTCVAGRHNQYELWPAFSSSAHVGDNLVLALEDTSATAGSPAKLSSYFESVSRGELVGLTRNGDTVAVRRLWMLRSYRGGWPVAGQI